MYWKNVDDWGLERWAMSHFQRIGVDYQTVNMDSLVDNSLTVNENKKRILSQYPEIQDTGPRQINEDFKEFQAQVAKYAEENRQQAERFSEPRFKAVESDPTAIMENNFQESVRANPMFSFEWWVAFLLQICVLFLVVGLAIAWLGG